MDSKAWKTILDELEGKNNHFLASGNTGLIEEGFFLARRAVTTNEPDENERTRTPL